MRLVPPLPSHHGTHRSWPAPDARIASSSSMTNIVERPVGVMLFHSGGQNEVKTCAARRVVGGPQAAVMRCNDGTADRQSQTGPVNLRGEKRIENLVRLLRG